MAKIFKNVLFLIVMILVLLSGCNKSTAAQESPDADWNLPETIEISDDITAVFNKAMEGLTGVDYEPLGYLGEKDGVYCILCRATVVYPDAKPYYALVYVGNDGVHNIWDIWMGAHSEKKE
ncbi:MAG: hypothetical protein IK151_08570 [Erysipelotrichaceae bacterium]|nr:hypothetical protein [Erysipelotrichaceae bacterium]